MLTEKDIKLLTNVFPTREELATKEEFEDLVKKVDVLQTSVDNLAKMAKNFR